MTTYALVQDGQIEAVGRLPRSARRLDTGEWVMGLDTAPPELRAATGWLPVADTERPADTDTTTHDHTVQLVDGQPTVTWVPRAKTVNEATAAGEERDRTSAAARAVQGARDLKAIAQDTGQPAVIRRIARDAFWIARGLGEAIRDSEADQLGP